MNAMIAPVTYSVRGKVIDRQSRQPVAYANVFVAGIPGKGASTDSLGTFKIEQVPPGIYSLEASCIGYQTVSTPEYIVSASTPFIEIEMEEDANLLNTVVVVPSPFRRSIESPVSMRIIGLQEIEKSPGANRDVSRIVRSYPGVSFSPMVPTALPSLERVPWALPIAVLKELATLPAISTASLYCLFPLVPAKFRHLLCGVRCCPGQLRQGQPHEICEVRI